MMRSYKRTTARVRPFGYIAFIAIVLLPVSAIAEGCAPIHAIRLPPVSQCYETVNLTSGEIMSLFNDLDLNDFELISARYERYREEGCPAEEREALDHPLDNAVVTREVVAYRKAIRIGDHLCKIKAIGSYGLDENWNYSKASGEAYLVKVIDDDTSTCDQFELSNYVLLSDPIPDQAVISLLRQSEQILQAAAIGIGVAKQEVCIRNIGVDEPSQLVSSYYFGIRPAPYKVFISFNSRSELVMSEIRR